MTENNKPKTRYFYPYCGHRLGFCLSTWGCRTEDKDHCIFFRTKHPYTGQRPQMVSGYTSKRVMYRIRKGVVDA